MHYERSRPRISPRDYKDFRVELPQVADAAHGFLGNISEDGLLLIVNADMELPEVGEELSGSVRSTRLSKPLHWRGSIVWKSESAVGGDVQQIAGVGFKEAVTLPDDLLALSMSTLD